MAFQSDYDTSQNPQFQQRVAVAIARVAANITSEDTGTANHANRAALAKLASNNPTEYASRFALVVMGNGAISNAGLDATDNDIEFAVGERWNVVAGVI